MAGREIENLLFKGLLGGISSFIFTIQKRVYEKKIPATNQFNNYYAGIVAYDSTDLS